MKDVCRYGIGKAPYSLLAFFKQPNGERLDIFNPDSFFDHDEIQKQQQKHSNFLMTPFFYHSTLVSNKACEIRLANLILYSDISLR